MLMKISGILIRKNLELRIVASIFFTLLLLPFDAVSSSSNQPLGYLYVLGELSLGWQNRELPIFDKPGGEIIGTINLARNPRNWCLQYPKIRGVRKPIAAIDSVKIGGCFSNFTYFEKVGQYSRILIDTFPEHKLWIKKEYALPENPLMQVSLETSPLGQINNSHSERMSYDQLHVSKPRKSPISNDQNSPALGYIKFVSSYGPGDTWSFGRWFLKEFPAADAPGGERIGSFNISLGLDLCLFNPSIRGVRFQALNEEVYRVAKCNLFTYYEKSKGHVRILDKSVPEGFWIPLEHSMPEDPQVKLTFGTRNFLENLDRIPSFYLSNYDGHSLMDRPSPNANVLVTLDSQQHALAKFTGEINGPWAKAIFYQISQYPSDEGCYTRGHLEPYKLATQQGWLKLLDDDGKPGEIEWEGLC